MAAPAASFLLFAVGSVLFSAFNGDRLTDAWLILLFMGGGALLSALWGFLRALAFGGAAMSLLGRAPARYRSNVWARLGSGLTAAAAYVGLALLLAQAWLPIGWALAPWTIDWAEGRGGPSPGLTLTPIIACILASGLVGGWVYHRLARRG